MQILSLCKSNKNNDSIAVCKGFCASTIEIRLVAR